MPVQRGSRVEAARQSCEYLQTHQGSNASVTNSNPLSELSSRVPINSLPWSNPGYRRRNRTAPRSTHGQA